MGLIQLSKCIKPKSSAHPISATVKYYMMSSQKAPSRIHLPLTRIRSFHYVQARLRPLPQGARGRGKPMSPDKSKLKMSLRG